MDEDFAEAAGKPLVLLGVDLLAAEEDHAMRIERGADIGDDTVVEVQGEVDAVNFCADRAGDGADFDGVALHRLSVCGRMTK